MISSNIFITLQACFYKILLFQKLIKGSSIQTEMMLMQLCWK